MEITIGGGGARIIRFLGGHPAIIGAVARAVSKLEETRPRKLVNHNHF